MTDTAWAPLVGADRNRLKAALEANAYNDAVLLTDSRDTSFLGTADEVPLATAIVAIKATPVHY